jgi:hypothetical protein
VPSPKLTARLAAAVVVASVVASWGGSFTAVTAALALGALLGTAWGLACPESRKRALVLTASALATAGLFVVDLGSWLRVVVAITVAHLVVAAVPDWLGLRRPRGVLRDLVSGPGIAVAVPAFLALAAFVTDRGAILGATLAASAPRQPALRLAMDALVTAAAVLLSDGARVDRPPDAALRWAVATVAALVAVARVAWVVSMATLPVEVSWSEAPALVNALKLDAHLPLYGPPAQLDSYTYSPLLDLVHRAVLSPVGLQLSLGAHRALGALAQLGACALLLWALGPRLRRAGWGGLTAAGVLLPLSLVNMLAPAVHPDHLVLLAFAVAVALLVTEESWPRALWWTALAAVTPLAGAAKLPGAGIGVGLALVFLLERRWWALAVTLASLAAAAATVPLFDATLGAYRFYAIDLQRSHPILPAKLVTLPTTSFGLVGLAVAVFLVAARRTVGRDALRIAVLTAACTLASVPAWIKYAGRDNNLTLLGVGAVCTWLVAGASHVTARRPAMHPASFPVGALLAIAAMAPPALPFVGAARAAALDDAAVVRRVVLDDTAAGRRPLLLLSVAAWVDAGRRDVPPDRFHSAIELYFGGFPEANLLPAHIADGRYDTVVVTGRQFRVEASLLGEFDEEIRAAIESHYALAGPPGARSIDEYPGALIFRRR